MLFCTNFCNSSVFRHMLNLVWNPIFAALVLSKLLFLRMRSYQHRLPSVPQRYYFFPGSFQISAINRSQLLCRALRFHKMTFMVTTTRACIKHTDKGPQTRIYRASRRGCAEGGLMRGRGKSWRGRPRRASFSASISVSNNAWIQSTLSKVQTDIVRAVFSQNNPPDLSISL